MYKSNFARFSAKKFVWPFHINGKMFPENFDWKVPIQKFLGFYDFFSKIEISLTSEK
jgi:hypothetical protein